MSSDLISRSALLELSKNERDIAHSKVLKGGGIFWIGVRGALSWCIEKLIEAPSVDAVEVVRCEECIKKKAGDVWNMCYVWETGVPNDGFCFKGERKDNATD